MSDNGLGLVRVSIQDLISQRQHAPLIGRKPPLFLSQRSGNFLSRFRGRGMEFAEVRPYMPGDDVRTIDWRVTARTGRAHTKLFREERERSVIIVVDLRRTMHFATRGVFKSVLACRLAALLAWQAQLTGDRLGGMVFSEQEHLEVRPQLGRQAVLALLYQLANHRSWQLSNDDTTDEESIYNVALRLRRVAHPGSKLIIISDFMHLDSRAAPHVRELSRHCDLRFIHLSDQLERELPPAGVYNFSHLQEKLRLFTGNRTLRQSYQQQYQQRIDRLVEVADRFKIALLQGETNSDPLTLLSQKWYCRGGNVDT